MKKIILITMLMSAVFAQGRVDLSDCNVRNWKKTYIKIYGGMRSCDLKDADLTGAELNGVKSGEIKGRPLSLPDGWSLVDGTLINDEGENLNSPDDMMDDGDDLKFENIDTDSDGCISEEEFEKAQKGN